jgi:hypothetical protein
LPDLNFSSNSFWASCMRPHKHNVNINLQPLLMLDMQGTSNFFPLLAGEISNPHLAGEKCPQAPRRKRGQKTHQHTKHTRGRAHTHTHTHTHTHSHTTQLITGKHTKTSGTHPTNTRENFSALWNSLPGGGQGDAHVHAHHGMLRRRASNYKHSLNFQTNCPLLRIPTPGANKCTLPWHTRAPARSNTPKVCDPKTHHRCGQSRTKPPQGKGGRQGRGGTGHK